MTSKKNSLVFFGSGPVAASSLSQLIGNFTVEGIITKPSTKNEMLSIAGDIPVYCVGSKLELDELIRSQSFSSEVGLLIDFGIIVSQDTIEMFKKGIINSHFSLLPELRGADPITFSILNGNKETGVSLMLLVEAMDEGPVIVQRSVTLDGAQTATSLTTSLISASYELIKEHFANYLDGVIDAKDQEYWGSVNNKLVSYTRKLEKSDGAINWNKDAITIEREIRAYIEWPKSYTKLGDIDVVITNADVIHTEHQNSSPGTINVTNKSIIVACSENSLKINRLKPSGKKEMTSQAFLAGYKSRLL